MIAAVFATWIATLIVANVHAELIITPFTGDSSLGNRKPGQRSDAIEGDIIPSPRLKRGLVRSDADARWQNGIVPYAFAAGYTSEQETDIILRMRKLENMVAINDVRCVQFRPKVPEDVYYITIQNGIGCRARVGKSKGNMTLQYPDCFDDGVIFHELLHTLGLLHEQSRLDRNLYVRVYEQNIRNGSESDFQIGGNSIADTLNTSYAYSSIMHYGKYDFSKNGLPTIEPIQPNIKIGQYANLTSADIQLVRSNYNCSATGPKLPPVTIPIKPAFANMTISTYSSELTTQNLKYARNGTSSNNFYYEVIQINILKVGLYVFQCYGNIDTFAYIYTAPFDPLNPANNLRYAFDDHSAANWEFSFMMNVNTPQTLTLVVTTYSPNVTGPFLIVASGNATVTFNRTGSTVPPTSTTSTTTATTTTTKTTTSTTSTTTTTTKTTTSTTSTTTTTTKTTTSTTSTTTTTTKTTTSTTSTPTTKTTTSTSTTAKTLTTTPNNIFNIGRWSATGSLSIGRVGHTSTLLSDGRVITIGGTLGGSTVELYNSATRTWSRGTSMNNARMYHTATLLPDGRLFVTGGWYYYAWINTAEIYNPVSNVWTAVSNLTFARFKHRAVYLPAPVNKVLVMGGVGENYALPISQSCELYDFASNKWTVITSMISPRTDFTTTYVPSMNVVVATGGDDGSNSAEIFNVSTLQWTRSLNTMSDYKSSHTATLLPDGNILVAGSYLASRSTYLFNPTTKLFTFAANITQERSESKATLLPSGSVLLTGGWNTNGSAIRLAEVYDYRLNAWRPVADMNTAHTRHTSILLNDSSSTSPTVLVIGGYQASGALTDCELFSVNG